MAIRASSVFPGRTPELRSPRFVIPRDGNAFQAQREHFPSSLLLVPLIFLPSSPLPSPASLLMHVHTQTYCHGLGIR